MSVTPWRRAPVVPFLAMDMLRLANERQSAGAEVLHLEIGQPGTPAPAPVLQAAAAALQSSRLGYTEALGTAALRQAIARHYGQFYGVGVPAERVAVTTGSSGGFLLTFLAAFHPGDRVALAAPCYPAYKNLLAALGLEAVLLPATAADDYQPTAALLDAVPGPLAGLLIASPANPTGTMLDRGQLQGLVDYARGRGIRLISDEIYHGITFGEPAVTLAELDPEAIVVNSFSKYFSMTGWRLGWLILPEALIRPVECLAQSLFISAPALSQEAAVAAFEAQSELDGHVAAYAEKRRFLAEALPAIGFGDHARADGAFYYYIDVGHLTNDSEAFCRQLLQETGVALTPGRDFDPDRGHRTLRLSFAGPLADIRTAVERLGGFLPQR